MPRNQSLEQQLAANLAEFSPSIEWDGTAYKLVARWGDKSVDVLWPYPLMEVFFDFFERGTNVFSDSIEFYEGESTSDLHDCLLSVIRRYLKCSTRIETLGTLLKRRELQVSENGRWSSVFE